MDETGRHFNSSALLKYKYWVRRLEIIRIQPIKDHGSTEQAELTRAWLAPGLWRHCSGEARVPGRHAVDRLLPKEESTPVTGWRQHQKGGKWMLPLRGPGPTSLNPMRPDSENTEPHI